MVAGAGIRMFEMRNVNRELQAKPHCIVKHVDTTLKEAGFDMKPTQSAICAVDQ